MRRLLARETIAVPGAAGPGWRFGLAALAPLVALMLAASVIPFAIMLWLSLSDFSFNLPGHDGSYVGLANYAAAWSDQRFHASLRLQALFIFVTVAPEFLLGLLFALAIWHGRRLTSVTLVLIALPLIIAPITVGMIWRLLLHGDYGPLGFYLSAMFTRDNASVLGSPNYAFMAVVLVDIWQWTPFFVIALLAALAKLPREPHLAAQADGASTLQVVRTVTLPLLRPTFVIVILLRIMDSFKEYDKIFVLTRGGPASATELVSPFTWIVAFDHGDLAYGSAITVILYIAIYGLCTLLFSVLRSGAAAR
ncbi:MAG TPA: sugar ABC transporter permease [Allosphingosinicella sp.]|jgi:multiple sugar transport system permease protein